MSTSVLYKKTLRWSSSFQTWSYFLFSIWLKYRLRSRIHLENNSSKNIIKVHPLFLPRSNVTNSINGRIWPYTGKIRSFTTMFCRITCDRISPYAYTVVLVRIQRKTEQNGDRKRSQFTRTVNDHIFVRKSPYFALYDMEIYDRNTITCKSSYFSVYGRLQPCLFDLGT